MSDNDVWLLKPNLKQLRLPDLSAATSLSNAFERVAVLRMLMTYARARSRHKG